MEICVKHVGCGELCSIDTEHWFFWTRCWRFRFLKVRLFIR